MRRQWAGTRGQALKAGGDVAFAVCHPEGAMIRTKLVLALAACAACTVYAAGATAPLEADLILSNGDFYTPNGWAASAAIKRGVIVAIGEASVVDRYKGPQSKVIDLHGAAVLPGLHDMHVHPMEAGLDELQ